MHKILIIYSCSRCCLQAKQREQAYILEDLQSGVQQSMCYMYYLAHNSKKWW
jgi:hypothetical protein